MNDLKQHAADARRAIIIGAGPAGLTAAWELLTRTGIVPLVLEQSDAMGGICRTVNYKGNRIDIGGHRFFSKSDRVIEWWLRILPLQGLTGASARITYERKTTTVAAREDGPDPEREDRVMLIRPRTSHIYFMRRFFDYPIALNADTLRKLGLRRTVRIVASYLRSVLFPIRAEQNLEQFFINRFGRELYRTFFKSYTEKVWGLPCDQISAEWGAQRVRGLSMRRAVTHFLKKLGGGAISHKTVETSLIEQFLYPKFGPGQMWEEVAAQIRGMGGEILTGWRVEEFEHDGAGRVQAVGAVHPETGARRRFGGDYFFSTMPVKELVSAMKPAAPAAVREIAEGLLYRDFITVGILSTKLRWPVCDNWIYIQEPDVLVGRIQIFNNWSPAMVADPSTVWIGLEYFCNEGDELWRRSDAEMIALAKRELASIEILDPADVLDATVLRMPKTYPAYFGTYGRFGEIAAWTDEIENLFLIGRNGMHRYNNQDHSMLAAMTAVDNIVANVRSRENLWSLNADDDYLEERSEAPSAQREVGRPAARLRRTEDSAPVE